MTKIYESHPIEVSKNSKNNEFRENRKGYTYIFDIDGPIFEQLKSIY